jgi:hypothetical protein
MDEPTPGQHAMRAGRYERAFDLLEEAAALLCDEAVFSDAEVAANSDLLVVQRATVWQQYEAHARAAGIAPREDMVQP